MKQIIIITVLILLLLTSWGTAQNDPPMSDKEKTAIAEKVKAEFMHSWNGYKKYAMGHDELKPLSNSFRDWHASSLLMTPVDALDVLYIMGFKKEADSTKEYIIRNLSFDHDMFVKNFEITIRILGGLLSSYQLSGDKRLLDLADDLGKRLLPVFNSRTGMPWMYVNLKTGEVRGDTSNPAEIGTLLIEFGALSKLTGKPVYYDKAKRALVELFNRRSSLGLVGSAIDINTGDWVDSTSHISGGIDSYYEYLLKCWLLFGDKDCEKMWKESISALNKYVEDKTESGFWYKQVNMYTGKKISTLYGALDAFFPAVLSLSGDINRAELLQESSYKMWTIAGIEPEEIDYLTLKITYPAYPLRPEIIESAYYLYHFTQNFRYLEMGKTILENLILYCRTESGYCSLKNVITKEKNDRMESFFLAETLKYLYLLFAEPGTIDFRNTIFNTEAHPIKRSW